MEEIVKTRPLPVHGQNLRLTVLPPRENNRRPDALPAGRVKTPPFRGLLVFIEDAPPTLKAGDYVCVIFTNASKTGSCGYGSYVETIDTNEPQTQ